MYKNTSVILSTTKVKVDVNKVCNDNLFVKLEVLFHVTSIVQ